MLVQRTDEELIRMVNDGNTLALQELYSRYSKKLVNYFFRMLGQDEAKAQDFLQDLFLKVLEQSTSFRGYRFSTWLYSIANNMCKNEYRRMKVRERALGLPGSYVLKETSDTFAFQRHLRETLLLLSDEDQELYALRFEAEASISDIALHFGCPEGTIKSRLFHLRKHLSKELKVFKILIDES